MDQQPNIVEHLPKMSLAHDYKFPPGLNKIRSYS